MKCVAYGPPYEKTRKIQMQNNLDLALGVRATFFITDFIFFSRSLNIAVRRTGKCFRGTMLEAL